MNHAGISATLLRLGERAIYTPPADPLEWMEQSFRVPDENGNPMPYRWDYAPFTREIFLELVNPDNREVSLQLFSRGFKTTLCLAAMTYFADQIPRPMANMRPSNKAAEEFVKLEVQPKYIDVNNCLMRLFGDGSNRRNVHVTILNKRFPGGFWKFLGANSATDIRQVQASVLWIDEMDSIEREAGDEGDPVKRFDKRGDQFLGSGVHRWRTSYPSTVGKSRIQRFMDASDGRRWVVHCLKCGDPWVMEREENLRYDDDNPEDAKLECPHCGAFHAERARIKMARAGSWVAQRPEIKLRPGFHAGSLLWPHATSDIELPGGYLQKLAEDEIAARASEDPEGARQTLVTMEDAQAYQPPQLDTPKPENVLARCEDYRPEIAIPEGVLVITLGADLQGDRIEAEIVGHGLGFREWGLGYYVLRGKPETEALQNKFYELLDMKFKHPILGEMGIDRGGLDCGFEPDWVKHVVSGRRHQMRAVRGSINYVSGPVEKVKSESFTYDGRSRRAKVYILNTHYLKKQVYDRLEINPQENKARSMHWPRGSGYDIKYFRGLTLEVPEERSKQGNTFLFFDDREVKGNEPLDARVYAKGLMPNLMKVMRQRAKKAETTADPDPKKPAPKKRKARGRNFVTDY